MASKASWRAPSKAFRAQALRTASRRSLEANPSWRGEIGVFDRPLEQRPGQGLVELSCVVQEPPEQVLQGPGPSPWDVASLRGLDEAFRRLLLLARLGQAAKRVSDPLRLPLAENGVRLPPSLGEEAGQDH
jgi:hypothetical protein